jgi:hypothetical protein
MLRCGFDFRNSSCRSDFSLTVSRPAKAGPTGRKETATGLMQCHWTLVEHQREIGKALRGQDISNLTAKIPHITYSTIALATKTWNLRITLLFVR